MNLSPSLSVAKLECTGVKILLAIFGKSNSRVALFRYKQNQITGKMEHLLRVHLS